MQKYVGLKDLLENNFLKSLSAVVEPLNSTGGQPQGIAYDYNTALYYFYSLDLRRRSDFSRLISRIQRTVAYRIRKIHNQADNQPNDEAQPGEDG